MCPNAHALFLLRYYLCSRCIIPIGIGLTLEVELYVERTIDERARRVSKVHNGSIGGHSEVTSGNFAAAEAQ